MRCYKLVNGAYLLVIGIGDGGTEISEVEYNNIKSVIDNKPSAPDGCGYRLTAEMEWELYKLPAGDTDPELSDSEALAIIMGGSI